MPLLLLSLSCSSEAPAAPTPLFADEMGLVVGAQGARIAERLQVIGDELEYPLYIHMLNGVPHSDGTPRVNLPADKPALLFEMYPMPGEWRWHGIAPPNRPTPSLPPGWRERFETLASRQSVRAERLGDRLELLIAQLQSELLASKPSQPAAPDAEEKPSPLTTNKIVRIRRAGFPGIPTDLAGTRPGPQPTPERAWLAWLELIHRGEPQASLTLYTDASRKALREKPADAVALKKEADAYLEAGYEVVTHDGRAVIHFPRESLALKPVFLVKSGEIWQVDWVARQDLIKTNVRGLWRFAVHENPYMFAFSEHLIDPNGYVLYRETTR